MLCLIKRSNLRDAQFMTNAYVIGSSAYYSNIDTTTQAVIAEISDVDLCARLLAGEWIHRVYELVTGHPAFVDCYYSGDVILFCPLSDEQAR